MSGCMRLEVPKDLVVTIGSRGGKASGPKDAKLMIDPEVTVLNKLRGHFPGVDALLRGDYFGFGVLRFCS